MSVPCNVEAGVKDMAGVDFVGVDELSKIKDETLQMRKAEVPKAQEIIKEHIDEFMGWLQKRKNVPMLKDVKTKLQQLYTLPLSNYNGELFALTMLWMRPIPRRQWQHPYFMNGAIGGI